MVDFTFIVLAFNEEQHLPRLMKSLQPLGADVIVVDSGSTDSTIDIAQKSGAHVITNPFENHPKQWDFALRNIEIKTPWVVCLDSDHILLPELVNRLANFTDATVDRSVNGIYFNRKNYFKGKWIKHGGYFPKYLLKMFRVGFGHSDLNENMDHRFVVSGKTIIWNDGYLKEENLKENKISFWIEKHNRYSDLVAEEEIERRNTQRVQGVKPMFFGSPDQRIAYYKSIWWRMPLFIRPVLYFVYRYFFQLGFLDGKQGMIFHYLQGFWFRFIVDVKIYELKKKNEKS